MAGTSPAMTTADSVQAGTALAGGDRALGAHGKNSMQVQCKPPVKSRGSLQSATRTFLIEPGVLRLRPTNRGTPSETTAATAAISPFRNASSALFCEPPAQASTTATSASRPGRMPAFGV